MASDKGRIAVPHEVIQDLSDHLKVIRSHHDDMIRLIARQDRKIDQIRSALADLLKHVSSTEQAKTWTAAAIPQAVINAEIALAEMEEEDEERGADND